MRVIRNQMGVAMVTVLFAGAALTVVASAAVFLTVKDLRSGLDDRRATEALAYAESGVDRLMQDVLKYNWGRLNEAGCKYEPIGVPPGDLGNQRTYDVYLTVYDPALPLPELGGWKQPGDAWSDTTNDSKAVCTARDSVSPTSAQLFAITSVGQHPTATRVVRQLVSVKARGFPIGLYADNVNVQGGAPKVFNTSLVTPGNVTTRENLVFTGYDPYYKLGHFWEGESMTTPAPAAVHAFGTISCSKQTCGNDQVEHPTTLECKANGANGQSQWDQSSGGGSLTGQAKCPGWTGSPAGPPPYSNFTLSDLERARPTPQLTDQDYADLKAQAKASGLYCAMTSAGNGTCTKPTGSFSTNGTIQDSDISGIGNVFVAYFDFPSSGDPFDVKSTVTWKARVAPCDDDQTVNRSVLLLVRYGSLDLTGKDEIVGAFLAPEGQIWMRGSGGQVKIEGTAISEKLDFGGNAEVENSECWVRNMPGGLLSATPQSWSEVDR
jgi:hypothetical protein